MNEEQQLVHELKWAIGIIGAVAFTSWVISSGGRWAPAVAVGWCVACLLNIKKQGQ